MNSRVADVLSAEVPLLRTAHIETIKWLAAVVMLVEHYFTYAIGHLPAEVYTVGRSVFPLFGLALGFGIAQLSTKDQSVIAARILVWSVVAFVAGLGVREALPYNVLGTLGLGLAGFVSLRQGNLWGMLLAILLSVPMEFGPAGVICVVAMCFAGGSYNSWLQIALVLAGIAVLAVPNGCHAAFLAIPVLIFVRSLNVELPRIGRVFYWIYALQWPALWMARDWIV